MIFFSLASAWAVLLHFHDCCLVVLEWRQCSLELSRFSFADLVSLVLLFRFQQRVFLPLSVVFWPLLVFGVVLGQYFCLRDDLFSGVA